MAQVGFDRRRINGPEESHIPVFDNEDEPWSLGKPRNGRNPTDIRPLCKPISNLEAIHSRFNLLINDNHIVLQPRLIDQANGSAYIETQRTKIACAVFVQMAQSTH